MKTPKSLAIVCGLLATAMVCLPQDLQNQEELARKAVVEHHFAEARNVYASLTAAHPEIVSYWTAQGRLSAYLGDYTGAISAYDKALALEPKNVETLVGKAYILLWQKNFARATLLLNEARALAPESTEVELAMAQESYYLNHPKDALHLVQRILVRNPKDTAALDLKSRLRSEQQIRIELGAADDSLAIGSARINGVSGLVDVGLVSPDNFISVHYENWLRFGEEVVRGGINFSHTFSYLWTVNASGLVGSRGDVLPHFDNSLGLRRRFRTGWAALATYRDLLFDQAHTRLVSPSLEYAFEKPISVQAIYSRGWSTYNAQVPLGQPTNSVSLRYNATISKFTLHAGWSRGVELFTIPFVDQLGQFRANTYTAGVDLPVSKVLTTKFDYAIQNRSSGAIEQTYAARLVFQK